MSIETVLGELRSRIEPLERLVQLFADSLEQPKLYRFDSDRGFRFETPDIRHFCLLKAIRVVSALNAALELVRGGYTQEFAVLLRTLVECTTHIEYVLDPDESEQHRAEVKKYVEAFFADSRRDPAAEIRKVQVRQGAVHTLLGRTLDTIAVSRDSSCATIRALRQLQPSACRSRRPPSIAHIHVSRACRPFLRPARTRGWCNRRIPCSASG
jgi:hypothetical protein